MKKNFIKNIILFNTNYYKFLINLIKFFQVKNLFFYIYNLIQSNILPFCHFTKTRIPINFKILLNYYTKK